MAFRFETNETAAAAFRRVAASQIVRARRQLELEEDHAAATHEARKCLKRLRALLRLVRPGLGEEQYRRENQRFRDIARMLSTARDHQVMRETVARLATGAGLQQQSALEALGEVLSNESSDGQSLDDVTQVLRQAVAALRRAKKDLKNLSLEFKREPVRAGLKRSYRAGQKALAAAMADPNSETIHEWRKTVQVHWRHMLLLSAAWPEYFAARSSTAKELSDLLGEDHDLALLIEFVANGEGSVIGACHAERVISLAAERQRQLRARAFTRGAYLFADDAKELSNTIYRYWSVARGQAQADVDEAPVDGISEHAGSIDAASDASGPAKPAAM